MTHSSYINDFLYFTFRPHDSRLLYCSGVNVDQFLPITKGRHRPMANPAIRGLQLVNLGVRALAIKSGAKPVTIKGNLCKGIVSKNNDWYRENLIIENAPDSFPADATAYAMVELMRKIDRSIMLGEEMPDKLLTPDELQSFLFSLCEKYGT
jgi:hypothetical protein